MQMCYTNQPEVERFCATCSADRSDSQWGAAMGSSREAELKMTADTAAPMLTVDDVRSRLNVSISTVRRLIRDRKLPAYRVGGRLRFKPEEVAAYIDAQRVDRIVPESPR